MKFQNQQILTQKLVLVARDLPLSFSLATPAPFSKRVAKHSRPAPTACCKLGYIYTVYIYIYEYIWYVGVRGQTGWVRQSGRISAAQSMNPEAWLYFVVAVWWSSPVVACVHTVHTWGPLLPTWRVTSHPTTCSTKSSRKYAHSSTNITWSSCKQAFGSDQSTRGMSSNLLQHSNRSLIRASCGGRTLRSARKDGDLGISWCLVTMRGTFGVRHLSPDCSSAINAVTKVHRPDDSTMHKETQNNNTYCKTYDRNKANNE